MFKECSGLTTITLKLPAETLAKYCYQDMFRTCINLQTAPELPATTLAEYCYSGMFYECTKLGTAPVLPAETLAAGCYQNMFYKCTSLTKVVLRATKDGYLQTATDGWLLNIVPSTSDGKTRTLYKASDLSLTEGDNYGYPTGWTIKALSDLTD